MDIAKITTVMTIIMVIVIVTTKTMTIIIIMIMIIIMIIVVIITIQLPPLLFLIMIQKSLVQIRHGENRITQRHLLTIKKGK